MTTYVQAGYGGTEAGSSFNITLSSSPTSGNLLLMGVGVNQYEGTNTPTPPLGWEEVTHAVYGNNLMYVYQKTATGSEGTSIAVSLSRGDTQGSGVIIEYTPCSLSQNNIVTNNHIVSIDPASESMRAVSIVVQRNSTPAINTSGWTDRASTSQSQSPVGVADRDSLTSGTGTITATWGYNSYSYVTFIGLLLLSASATGLPRRALDGPFYGSLRGSVR